MTEAAADGVLPHVLTFVTTVLASFVTAWRVFAYRRKNEATSEQVFREDLFKQIACLKDENRLIRARNNELEEAVRECERQRLELELEVIRLKARRGGARKSVH